MKPSYFMCFAAYEDKVRYKEKSCLLGIYLFLSLRGKDPL